MEFRQHQRFRSRFDVGVVDLKRDEPAIKGEMVDLSSSGVCVVIPSEIAIGTLVKVEFSEGILFGEVIHVSRMEEGYRTGIEIFDILLEKSDLGRLVENALRPERSEIPSASSSAK